MKQIELPIPSSAHATDATELVRIWIANGRLHVSLATEVWPDPAAWGLLLIDVARHVARAYEQTGSTTEADAFAKICNAATAELAHPTGDTTGSIVS